MNYYEHHLGDYAEATAHLSFLEDAAYSRLIRKYYATEKPLPADLATTQRLIGARTDEERAAVETVLREFFMLLDDGWHQERCDAEIERYRAREPDRAARRANETSRVNRHRAERAVLFAQLAERGGHAPWNVSMAELRAAVAAHVTEPVAPETLQPLQETKTGNAEPEKTGGAPAAEPESSEKHPETPKSTAPATAPVTPATALQTPDTSPHTPDKREEREAALAAPRSPRGSRLLLHEMPDDYRGFCRKERPDLDPESTWKRFHDYWSAAPGKGGVKLDWLATWRNWVRSERGPQTGRAGGFRGRPDVSLANDQAALRWLEQSTDDGMTIDG